MNVLHNNTYLVPILMCSINAKVFELQVSNYLSKLIYAQFDDIERDWNGTPKYSPLMYQNYQNLLLDKASRAVKLANRFTVSTEVRQFLMKFFTRMIEEMSVFDIADYNDIPMLIEDIDASYSPECYTSFMYTVSENYKNKFGTSLKHAGDTTRWFHQQIIGAFPKYITQPKIHAMIFSFFESYLKALAWNIGTFIWQYEVSISSELFLGILALQSFNQILIDELVSGLRLKPPVKNRAKKTSKVNTLSVDKPAADARMPVTTKTAPATSSTYVTERTISLHSEESDDCSAEGDFGDKL